MKDRYTYTIKLDGKRLFNQVFFNNFNWKNFNTPLTAVYVEDNYEIQDIKVFFMRNTGQVIHLMSRAAIMAKLDQE